MSTIYYLLSLVFLVLVVIVVFIFRRYIYAWRKANELYLKNAPSEYKIENGGKYIGIIAITANLPEEKYHIVYDSGPMLFIEHLKELNKPFKLVTDVNKENFSELVNDPNCNELYILGHGRRYGLLITKDKKNLLKYSEFEGSPKKDKVIQLHCNHKKGKSLTEYLDAKSDFKERGKRSNWKNMNYFLRKIENKEK